MSGPELVEDKGEPVCIGYTFYRTAYEAAEALWDDGKPADAVAHPCTVGPAFTPDIAEYVLEAWAEQFENSDEMELSTPVQEACVAFQKVLETNAPTCWTPRTRERVSLPAVNVPA